MTTAAAATPPNGAAGAPAAGSTPSAGAPAGNWFDGIDDPELKSWVQTKNFPSVKEALGAYRKAEGFIGAPVDKLVRLPNDPSDEAAWGEVYGKMGRPAKPEDYKIPVPEGSDGQFAKDAAPVLHKLGLNQRQAEELGKWWNDYATNAEKASLEARSTENKKQEAALRGEWGDAFDQNQELARTAAKEYGLDEATIDKLEESLGFAGVMKLFHAIGSKQGEAKFVEGTGGGGGFKLGAAQAAERIKQLRADTDFQRKFNAGESAAVREWTDLHKVAYPGELTFGA